MRRNTVAWVSVLLTAGLVVAGCRKEEKGEAASPAPASQPVVEEAKKEKSGPDEVLVLESLLKDEPTVDQCYNARAWKPGYSLEAVVERNFWWKPADDAVASTGTLGDPYLDTASYRTGKGRHFVDKYVTFMKDDPSQQYDVFTGKGQSATYDCNYKVYTVIGHEALIFVPYEEIPFSDLMDMNDGMFLLGANAYDLYDVDGVKTTVTEADFLDGKLVRHGETVDAVCGDTTVSRVRDIAPSGLDSSSEPVEDGISHLVVALDADGVYGAAPDGVGNVAGSYYQGYDLGTLYRESGGDATDVTVNGTIYDVAALDGWRLVYLPKSTMYVALAPRQVKGVAEDIIPDIRTVAIDGRLAVAGLGRSVAEVLADAGSTGNSFALTMADGSTRDVKEADLAGISSGDVAAIKVVD